MQLPDRVSDLDTAKVNATILPAEVWSTITPNGTTYNSSARVGVLALGRDTLGIPGYPYKDRPSIVEQIKNSGVISSNSFGLHIGSVPLNQPGSLILGGYDSNRVLGTVGVFRYQDEISTAPLVDVVLGVEEGGSPFKSAFTGSVYKGNNGTQHATDVANSYGAPAGSIIVTPNPAAPYLSLPYDTCDALASHLPVSWNPNTGLYTWNTNDPQYALIVNSPAHLEFILADMNAMNISIKVPFKLLNLTLEPPLVASPIPYFPCQPFNATDFGTWVLGRAFLQAAFMGVSLDQNLTFLAQAPGPLIDQAVTQTLQPTDTNLTSSSTSSFKKSWGSILKALPGPTTPDSSSNSTTDSSSTLTPGAKAGIAVGVVAAALILAAAIFYILKRRRRTRGSGHQQQQQAMPGGPAAADDKAGGRDRHEMNGTREEGYPEMNEQHGVSDLSRPLPHEMDPMGRVYPDRSEPVEVWAGGVPEGRRR